MKQGAKHVTQIQRSPTHTKRDSTIV